MFTGHLRPGPRETQVFLGQRGVGVRSRRLRRRRVEPGRRATVGNGDLLGRVRVILRGRTGRAGEATGSVGGASRPGATGPWFSRRIWATPTGLGEDGSDWHQDRWHGQPGQRESVTTGSVAGNRCRNRKAASPAAPQGETGDVLIELKANARRSTSGGPVRLRRPGGCAAQAASPPGLSCFSGVAFPVLRFS